MKKTMKIVSALLVIMTTLCTLSTMVSATNVINQLQTSGNEIDSNDIANFGGTIIKTGTTIGAVVAVIVLLVLGIKYMIGSTSEKAEYKKSMIPYLVGAILVFGACAVARIVVGFATNFN